MNPTPALAAVAVGVTLGAIAAALGAPLWGALVLGAGGLFVSKKAIDAATA